MKVTKIVIKDLKGSQNSVVATWNFSEPWGHVTGFSVRWDYFDSKARRWVYGSVETIDDAEITQRVQTAKKTYGRTIAKANAARQSVFAVPIDGNPSRVRVRVRPNPETYEQTVGNKKHKKTVPKTYFLGEWATSAEYGGKAGQLSNVKAAVAAANKAKLNASKNGDAAYKSAKSNEAAAKAAKDDTEYYKLKRASLYEKAAEQYGDAASWFNKAERPQAEQTASQAKVRCEQAAEAADVAVYNFYIAQAKAELNSKKTFHNLCSITAKVSSATAKKTAQSKLPSGQKLAQNSSKTAWGYFTTEKAPSDIVKDASADRKAKKYGDSAKKERQAAKRYDSAASWYDKAAGSAPDAGKKAVAEQNADAYEARADACEDRAKSDDDKQDEAKALAEEKAAVPAAPSSVDVLKVGTQFTVTWTRQAGWARYGELLVRTDRKGSYVVVETVDTPIDSERDVLQRAEFSGESGHIYEFAARSVLPDKKTKSAITYASESVTVPARGKNVQAAISDNGNAVVVKWRPDPQTESTVDSYEVQYSNVVVNGQNAWIAGATESIQTYDAQQGADGGDGLKMCSIDVTSWDEGSWYFRVYAKNDAGLSLPFLRDGDEHEQARDVTVSVTLKKASATMSTPTGLKCMLAENAPGNVILEWTDTLERDAKYEIDHTHNPMAYEQNAKGDISTDTWDDSEDIDKSAKRVFTVTGLELGRTYWFRVRKVAKDGSSRPALAASGDTYADVNVCRIDVPPASETKLTPRPSNLTCEVMSYDGAIKVKWSGRASGDERFVIERSSNASAYADNAVNDITSEDYENPPSGATEFEYTLTGLETGRTWHIRVRKAAESGFTEWATLSDTHPEGVTPSETPNVVSVLLPPSQEELDKLSAPTASTPAMAYQVGDSVIMSWVHNSDGSTAQTAYQVEVTVAPPESAVSVTTIDGTTDNAITYDTSQLGDGTSVSWRVRTQGAYEGFWSPWSQTRTFSVFAQPSTTVSVADGHGSAVNPDGTVSALPLSLTVGATTATGNPLVEVRLSIVSVSAHGTMSDDGEEMQVAAGEEVWYKYVQASEFSEGTAVVTVAAGDAVLDTGYSYTVRAIAYTQMGLSAHAPESTFSIDWGSDMAAPSGSAQYDPDDYACRIFPACWIADPDGQDEPFEVLEPPEGDISTEGEEDEGEFIPEDDPDSGSQEGQDAEPEESEPEPAPEPDEEDVPPAITPDEQSLLDMVDAEDASVDESSEPDFSNAIDEQPDPEGRILRPNTLLDVYRINFDGSLTAIATGLPNDGYASCTDPHPRFGICTYRVVAHDTSMDVQTSSELSVDVPVSRVVITWDETWRDTENATEDDFTDYAGRIVELPWDVQLQERHSIEKKVNRYQGRRLGVSYYGSSVTGNASFNANIRRDIDDDTLAALRALAVFPGDCYVRDRTGLGFWATAEIDFNHTFESQKVGISIEFERVEGPVVENA